MHAGGDHDDPHPVAAQGGGDACADQRGLAAPRRPDDGEDRAVGQPSQTRGDVGIPTEEHLRVVDVVRLESPVRAHRARLRQRALHDQRRILPQDRLLQGGDLRSRIQAEFTIKHRAELAERAQRLTLTAGLVLRGGQQRPPTFAQRGLSHQRLRLRQDPVVLACPQGGLDVQLLGCVQELGQPGRLDPRGVPSVDLGQRPAPPQRQRVRQHKRRPLRVIGGEQVARPRHGTLEALRVDLVQRHDQPIAQRGGLDRMNAQQLAQPDHAPLHDLGPRRRQLLTPQHVGQHLGADHLPRVDDQSREYDAITSSENLVFPLDRERAENGDTHTSTVDPPDRRQGRRYRRYRAQPLDTAGATKADHRPVHPDPPASGGPVGRENRRSQSCPHAEPTPLPRPRRRVWPR